MTALAQAVSFDDATMVVTFTDGPQLSVPPLGFLVAYGYACERLHYEIGAGGRSLHSDIDEDLSVAQLLAGADQYHLTEPVQHPPTSS